MGNRYLNLLYKKYNFFLRSNLDLLSFKKCSLFPYLEKEYIKIHKIKSIVNQLSEQHLKTLTFTETPDIHNDLLTQIKEQLHHLEQVIAANKNDLWIFENLEKELFVLKQRSRTFIVRVYAKDPQSATSKTQKRRLYKAF